MRDRARFAEIASAAAVVISLIFVGLEVRESARQTELNTQSLQLSAYQDLIGQIGTINVLNIQNPKEGEPTSWEGLSFRESEQLYNRYFLVTRHGDMAFYQYELGMLTDERLESALGPLNVNLCSPVFRSWWSDNRGAFVVSYRNFLDGKISARECRGEWRDE